MPIAIPRMKRYLEAHMEDLEALQADCETNQTLWEHDARFRRQWWERADAWRAKTAVVLRRVFGPDSEQVNAFAKVFHQGRVARFFAGEYGYRERLRKAKTQLETVIWELELSSQEELAHGEPPRRLQMTPAKVFIAHSGESPALNRLVRFLRALDVDPQIAEWLPYSGAQVPDHVRSVYQDCECAVVFAEATEQVGDRGRPGRGVLIEVGLLREHFENRIVYLREQGAELGPMAEGFASAFFTQDSLEEASYRIVVEFKNWGLV